MDRLVVGENKERAVLYEKFPSLTPSFCMSTTTAIFLQDISKSYRVWKSPEARVAAALWRALGREEKARDKYRDVHALSNVSINVKKGEGLGIIGLNGSGKSTLLQIIAGTLRSSSGTVTVNGRVAALLELGAG